MSLLEALNVARKERIQRFYKPRFGRLSSETEIIPQYLYERKQREVKPLSDYERLRNLVKHPKSRFYYVPVRSADNVVRLEDEPQIDGPAHELFVVRTSHSVTHETIMRAVCRFYDVSSKDICSKRREHFIAWPRQVFAYLCRELTRLSFPQIGEKTGNRDHTTAYHACNKIRFLIEDKNPEVVGEISAIKAMLTGTENGPR